MAESVNSGWNKLFRNIGRFNLCLYDRMCFCGGNVGLCMIGSNLLDIVKMFRKCINLKKWLKC